METGIARNIRNKGDEKPYDEHCKAVLQNKTILAYILKNVASEVKDMEISEIAGLINGTPAVSSIPVMPGNDFVGENNLEDKQHKEGTLYYDIRFTFYADKEHKFKIYADVEAQNKFNPGYSIVTRGIVYCARMISAQAYREFNFKKYDGLKKVYSIWLCVNADKKIGNAISEYKMTKHDILPGMPDDPSEYDKLSVVMVCLQSTKSKLEEEDLSCNELIRLLYTLFHPGIQTESRISILESDFHIQMDDGLGKEIETMCNVSEAILEYGVQQGLQQGKEQGYQLGVEEGRVLERKSMLLKLMKMDLPFEKALEVLEIPESEWDNYRNLVEQK